jgi:hypothetical protein
MNLTDRHSGVRPGSSAGGSARLMPVLARALETGRGPAGLVGWLNDRGAAPATVARLAGELDRAVRRAGVAETLRE